MVFIDRPDDFIAEVSKLYEKNKEKGSVWLTFKKYTPTEPKKKSEKQKQLSKEAVDKKQQEKSKDQKKPPQQQKKKKPPKLQKEGCLVRATDGDVKISTIILQKEVARFQGFLFNICSHNFKLKRKITEQKEKEQVPSKIQKIEQISTATTTQAKEVAQKKKKNKL